MKETYRMMLAIPLLVFMLGAEESCESPPGGVEPVDPGGPFAPSTGETSAPPEPGGTTPGTGDPLPSDPGNPLPGDIDLDNIPNSEANQPDLGGR